MIASLAHGQRQVSVLVNSLRSQVLGCDGQTAADCSNRQCGPDCANDHGPFCGGMPAPAALPTSADDVVLVPDNLVAAAASTAGCSHQAVGGTSTTRCRYTRVVSSYSLNGNATRNLQDGDTYTGQWVAGTAHGLGRYLHGGDRGSDFDGDWVFGFPSGRGTEELGNGERYIGQMVQGCRSGHGKLYDKQGRLVYDGQFLGDSFHGEAKQILPNCRNFCGQFIEGAIHGHGTLEETGASTSGVSFVYTGSFDSGKFHGKGALRRQVDGRRAWSYSGQWEHGVPCGCGVELCDNGSWYVGEFKEGRRDGQGYLLDSSGSVFDGSFNGGMFHGMGSFSWSDGCKYTGSFLFGRFSGRGCLTWPGGRQFYGDFCEGFATSVDTEEENTAIRSGEDAASQPRSSSRNPGATTEAVFDMKQAPLVPSSIEKEARSRNFTADGSSYVGEWVGELRFGEGIQCSTNGDRYEGQFVNDKREGKGKFASFDGASFTGSWLNDMYHGEGSSTSWDGSTYNGQWCLNMSRGIGDELMKDGSSYSGQFVDGSWHGKGTFSKNGVNYQGFFLSGNFHGDGVYREQGSVFEGQYFKGLPEGYCKVSLPDDSVYEGGFADGQAHGQGRRVDRNSGTLRAGQWSRGSLHGQGVELRGNGTWYVGRFYHGLFDGNSRHFNEEGALYSGGFIDGQMHGDGTYVWPDGRQYVGGFHRGLQHGFGTYTDSRGQSWRGIWRHGEETQPFRRMGDKLERRLAGDDAHMSDDDDVKPKRVDSLMRECEPRLSCVCQWSSMAKLYNSEFQGEVKKDCAILDGRRYTGQWNDGQPNGFGILFSSDGGSFEGQFSNGVAHGLGVRRITGSDGSSHFGLWFAGKAHGPGFRVRCHPNSIASTSGSPSIKESDSFARGLGYSGQWVLDRPHGEVTALSEDESAFIGQFRGSVKNGRGVLFESGGRRYEGNFKDDRYHGFGCILRIDGTWCAGRFEDGRLTQPLPRGEEGEEQPVADTQGEFKDSSADPDADKLPPNSPSPSHATSPRRIGTKHEDNKPYPSSWPVGSRYRPCNIGPASMYKEHQAYPQLAHECDQSSVYTGEWVGNRRTGDGVQYWANGQVYQGQFLDNRFDGMGHLVRADGSRHVGVFRDDQAHGDGTFVSRDGRFYSGTWSFGSLSGEGTEFRGDGRRYTGQFQNMVKVGYGHFAEQGGNNYYGIFAEGKFHGTGLYTWMDGRRFCGQFRHGKRHGCGSFTDAQGKRWWGRWCDGTQMELVAFEGQDDAFARDGVYETLSSRERVLPDGGKCIGQWMGPRLLGDGMQVWPDGKIYQGQFAAGSPDGRGRMVYPDGSVYHGRFALARKSGEGFCIKQDQRIYFGQWWDDAPHGDGMEANSCGVYAGQFVNGVKSGSGKIFTVDSKVYVGEFSGGSCQGRGVLLLPCGSRYTGEFRKRANDGESYAGGGIALDVQILESYFHGEGVLTKSNGSRCEGNFEKGEFVRTSVDKHGGKAKKTGNYVPSDRGFFEAVKKKSVPNDNPGTARQTIVLAPGESAADNTAWVAKQKSMLVDAIPTNTTAASTTFVQDSELGAATCEGVLPMGVQISIPEKKCDALLHQGPQLSQVSTSDVQNVAAAVLPSAHSNVAPTKAADHIVDSAHSNVATMLAQPSDFTSAKHDSDFRKSYDKKKCATFQTEVNKCATSVGGSPHRSEKVASDLGNAPLLIIDDWGGGYDHDALIPGTVIKTWEDGRHYTGDWVDDIPQGHGEFTSKNGTLYVGQFQKGRVHGAGILESAQPVDSPDGRGDASRYRGQFEDGTTNGFGVLEWPDGTRFEGTFARGTQVGCGKYILPSGVVRRVSY